MHWNHLSALPVLDIVAVRAHSISTRLAAAPTSTTSSRCASCSGRRGSTACAWSRSCCRVWRRWTRSSRCTASRCCISSCRYCTSPCPPLTSGMTTACLPRSSYACRCVLLQQNSLAFVIIGVYLGACTFACWSFQKADSCQVACLL